MAISDLSLTNNENKSYKNKKLLPFEVESWKFEVFSTHKNKQLLPFSESYREVLA